MMKNNRTVALFFAIILFGVVILTSSYVQFRKAETKWENYATYSSQLDFHFVNIENLLGYGGFIHHFKNLVLRRDITRYKFKTHDYYKRLSNELDILENIMKETKEKSAIQAIQKTIDQYYENSLSVTELIKQNTSVEKIDQSVIVNDDKAISSIHYLIQRIKQRLEVRRNDALNEFNNASRSFLLGTLLLLSIATAGGIYVTRIEKMRLKFVGEIIRLKDNAVKANQAKSDFLSSMSHELRTPLNAISGYAQLFKMDDSLSEINKENANEILKAGNHLIQLINEILDLAKIEAGKITLSIEAVSLKEIFMECIAITGPLAEQKNITISFDDASSVYIKADNVRIKQSLLNLISNAIKYNRDSGSVKLHYKKTGNHHLRIEVTDTGPGLTEEQMAKIFEPFDRLGHENSDIEGTGIGLSISKNLIELMGGEIGVESVQDRGSTFWITLPLAEIKEIKQKDIDAITNSSTELAFERVNNILYVEDNPSNLKLMSKIMSSVPNVNLMTAHLPSLGLEILSASKVDLILLDINLPEMNGYEFLEKVKADPGLRQIPVFALTANAMDHHIEKGMKAGFNEYLTKPLDVRKLMALLEKYLQKPSA